MAGNGGLSGCNQASQFVLLGTRSPWKSSGKCLQVFQTCSSVVKDNTFLRLKKTIGEKLFQCRDACASFRGGENSGAGGELHTRVEKFLVTDGDSRSSTGSDGR